MSQQVDSHSESAYATSS